MTNEIQKALQTLRDNAESDFERHRIDVLERDLTNPPTVEIIDDKHQRFLGISFRKRKEGHYFNPCLSIYRLVWLYHYGELPPKAIIHHIDHDKNNNNITNLIPMLPEEHRKHHAKGGFGHNGNRQKLPQITLTCSLCGKTYSGYYKVNDSRCPDCRKQIYREKAKQRARHKASEKRAKRLSESYHNSGIRQCQNCGEAYYYDAGHRNGRWHSEKYCSVECAKIGGAKANKVDRSRVCLVCGKQFEYKHKCQKTCSPECGRVLTLQAIKSRPLKRVISHCELCGKEIEHLPSDKPRFCSQDCVHKYMAKVNTKTEHVSPKEIRTCICCGKPFRVTKTAAKQWCSPECHQRLRTKQCPICGMMFAPKKKTQECCSKKCARHNHA